MIRAKNHKVLASILLVPYDPRLIDIILWLSGSISEMIFTSAYRPHTHGVHGTIPCRATDLRSWVVEMPERICDAVNLKWMYDPSRPAKKCAIHHAICPKCKSDNRGYMKVKCINCGEYIYHEWHIHLQVHPNTIKRGDGK